jgi:hypothetical protein
LNIPPKLHSLNLPAQSSKIFHGLTIGTSLILLIILVACVIPEHLIDGLCTLHYAAEYIGEFMLTALALSRT